MAISKFDQKESFGLSLFLLHCVKRMQTNGPSPNLDLTWIFCSAETAGQTSRQSPSLIGLILYTPLEGYGSGITSPCQCDARVNDCFGNIQAEQFSAEFDECS
jgi:hypothetical protein